MKLHLHVKTEYFRAIKSGDKTHEFRLVNDYWRKRVEGRDYDAVVIYNAYKAGTKNQMEFAWGRPQVVLRTHPHFGPNEVHVYAIDVTRPMEAVQ